MAINALAEIVRQGKGVICGQAAFPANGILAVSTGLATIDGVSASIVKATAPTTSVVTWTFAGGVVTFRGWMPTAAGTTTLIASTAQETVNYTIIGRRRK